MSFYDESDREAARLYASGLELVREGDRMLTDAFKAPQHDDTTLLELLLLQREAIAKQREGLSLIDIATEMRCAAIRNRQGERQQQQRAVPAYPGSY